jgi:DNA-3-methyladenine glycosylase II
MSTASKCERRRGGCARDLSFPPFRGLRRRNFSKEIAAALRTSLQFGNGKSRIKGGVKEKYTIHYSHLMKFVIPEEILKDKKLAKWVREHGLIDDKDWRRPKNPFHSLIRSIIYQQVSGKAAASILKKFKSLFGGKFPTPEMVLAMSEAELRSAGLSGQKARYIRDLAEKFADGTIASRKFPKMTNDEIIEHLTRVKGIGVWTAHMFLLFTLRRPDVLPTLDLGVRKGFQAVYGLRKLPSHEKMEKLAKGWRKHASTASLYFWRIADGAKTK